MQTNKFATTFLTTTAKINKHHCHMRIVTRTGYKSQVTRPVRSGKSFGGAYRTRTYGPKISVTD